jgi:hypothetical protein
MARNAGISDGAWHSFGSSGRGASRSEASFSGGTRGGFNSGFGYRDGFGYRGGFGGWGCCRFGFGFGFGWGGWGFGFGWPFWGPYWGYAWGPWYYPYGYDPYWYSPWPAYNYYQDDSYNWSTNPPPYRPSDENNQPANYTTTPGSNYVAASGTSEPILEEVQQ